MSDSLRPLWQLTAAELARGFRAGDFLPSDALRACLERSAHVNRRLNALVAMDAQAATGAALESDARWRAGRPLGALDGVPATVKDNMHVRGMPTRWGSLATQDAPAQRDEWPVARLRAAGALIFGKTNVPEFTMQGYTDNPLFGPTGNPWDPALTPGGSSGGAAALVAAGGCPIALGTDGGGSIRRPASHCNLVGFKPSRGRVPRGDGLPPIFLDFEVVGPLTRSVGDALSVMDVIGPAMARPAAAPARILFVPAFADHPVDRRIAALTADAAEQFIAMGHGVERAGRFDLAEDINQHWSLLAQSGLAWLVDHPQELQRGRFDSSRFGDAMRRNEQAGREASAAALFGLFYAVQRLRGDLSALFAQCDFLLTPCAAALPWPAGQTHPPEIDGRPVGPRGHAVFAGFVNAAGLPAISLPCGFVGDLPVGLQLVGPEGSDDALLALSARFEEACPWRRFPEL